MAKTVFGEGTVTLVTLSRGPGGKLEVARKFRVSGPTDVEKYFAVEAGRPVVGPLVYRELTARELEERGLPVTLKRTGYLQCLVPALPAPGGAADEAA